MRYSQQYTEIVLRYASDSLLQPRRRGAYTELVSRDHSSEKRKGEMSDLLSDLNVEEDDLPHLVGGMDEEDDRHTNQRSLVKHDLGMFRGSLSVFAYHPTINFHASLRRDPKSDTLVLHNEAINVPHEYQGLGIGTNAFVRQVSAALGHDIARIDTVAVRGEDNGYYTWPRLGFDADFEKQSYNTSYMDALRRDFPGVTTLQDLLHEPGGLKWWKKNGRSVTASFDLAPDSRSMEILNQYLHERKKRTT